MHAQRGTVHIQPLVACRVDYDAEQPKSPLDALLQLLRDLIPDNLVGAAVQMNMLGIIFFSVCFGAAVTCLADSAAAARIEALVDAVNSAIINMVSAAFQCIQTSICFAKPHHQCLNTEMVAWMRAIIASSLSLHQEGLSLAGCTSAPQTST